MRWAMSCTVSNPTLEQTDEASTVILQLTPEIREGKRRLSIAVDGLDTKDAASVMLSAICSLR